MTGPSLSHSFCADSLNLSRYLLLDASLLEELIDIYLDRGLIAAGTNGFCQTRIFDHLEPSFVYPRSSPLNIRSVTLQQPKCFTTPLPNTTTRVLIAYVVLPS